MSLHYMKWDVERMVKLNKKIQHYSWEDVIIIDTGFPMLYDK